MEIITDIDRKSAFEFYGFFLGGVIPVCLAVIFPHFGLAPTILDSKLFYIIVIIFILVSVAVFLVINRLSNKHPWYKNITTTLNLFQAGYSLLVIHFFVAYFGGVKESVFAFSYLYLPAVVGYVWGGKTLFFTGSLCGLLFFLNAVYPNHVFYLLEIIGVEPLAIEITKDEEVIEVPSDNTKTAIDWLYISIFMIQLIVTMVLASKEPLKS